MIDTDIKLRIITCADCEYFDRGAANDDGYSDCLSPLSDRFQTFAVSPTCKSGFYPDTSAVKQ